MSSSPMAKTYSFSTLQQASEYFLKQGWTDGLPINLPTEQEVSKLIDLSGKSYKDVVGVEAIGPSPKTADVGHLADLLPLKAVLGLG